MIFKVTRLSTELNNLVVYQLYSVRNVEKVLAILSVMSEFGTITLSILSAVPIG